MGDVGAALLADRGRVLVHELPVVGDPFRVVLGGPVGGGIRRADTEGAGVHDDLFLLVGDHVRPGMGGRRVLTEADRHAGGHLTVVHDLHLLGLAVGLGDPRVVDLVGGRPVRLAVDA